MSTDTDLDAYADFKEERTWASSFSLATRKRFLAGETEDLNDFFYGPAYRARSRFGLWDACDPVAAAIVNLTAAQNDLAHAISEDVDYGTGDIGNAASVRVLAIAATVDALADAIDQGITGALKTHLDRAAVKTFARRITASLKRTSAFVEVDPE